MGVIELQNVWEWLLQGYVIWFQWVFIIFFYLNVYVLVFLVLYAFSI